MRSAARLAPYWTPLDALGFFAPFVALTIVWIEQLLAQPDGFRRHFDQFIVLDIGERLFQRHADRRRQPDRLILGMGAGIGQLLALEHIDFEIVVARVLANDHAAIDLPARFDHHWAAVF